MASGYRFRHREGFKFHLRWLMTFLPKSILLQFTPSYHPNHFINVGRLMTFWPFSFLDMWYVENRKDNYMWDKEENMPEVSIKNIGHLIMDYGEEKIYLQAGQRRRPSSSWQTWRRGGRRRGWRGPATGSAESQTRTHCSCLHIIGHFNSIPSAAIPSIVHHKNTQSTYLNFQQKLSYVEANPWCPHWRAGYADFPWVSNLNLKSSQVLFSFINAYLW